MSTTVENDTGRNDLRPPRGTLLMALAEFAESIGSATTPAEVRRQAALCILDTLGCMLAGTSAPETAAFARGERRSSGEALSAIGQARILGYAGDVFELNDLVGGHASVGTVTAALVTAREENATGTELLNAVVAGDEVTSRIFESQAWGQKAFTDNGIVITSTQSAIGTAAAVARLRGHDLETMTRAMAIAGAIACWGPAEVIFGDGGTIKPSQFGAAPAESALRGADYAAEGITGPLRLIESPIGLMTAHAHEYNEDTIRGDGTWYLLRMQRKLHASCGFTHSSIDAVRSLVGRGVDVAGASRIVLRVPDYIIPAVGKSARPVTANDARFHLGYCGALAALGADVILPEHSVNFEHYLANPDVVSLMGRIEIRPLEINEVTAGQRYNKSAVEVTIDGEIIRGGCDAPRGAFAAPLDDVAVIEKFRTLASTCASQDEAEACVQLIDRLDDAPDCTDLYKMIDLVLSTVSRESSGP